tara:strand:- start:21409 stop:21720 length:312 start_codon:yes stop_codon:yes gene_type:complete
LNKNQSWIVLGTLAFISITLFVPELSFAQYGGGDFQSKVGGVTKGLVNVLLPAVSVLGLVYAAILAATGDAEAKSRMVLVAVASIVGFLAPMLIRWLQSISGM